MMKGNSTSLSNGLSIQSAEIETFKPTLAMEKWLDTAVQSDETSITKLAEESGLDRKNWYKWIKDDNFRLWFKQEWDKRIAGEAWKLDKIGMKQATKDYKYWEGMQKRVGNLVDGNNTVVPVQINNFINKEKDEFNI